MLFVIKSLFVLFFVHSVSQANADTLNALNVPHVGEKEDQKIKLMLVSSVSVKCGTIGLIFIVGNQQFGGGDLCQMCDPAVLPF